MAIVAGDRAAADADIEMFGDSAVSDGLARADPF